MSSATGPSLAHRTVSSIRAGGQSAREGTPGSPHTPTRPISTSAYGSPSGRIEDDAIIIELGCRNIRLGFAGDSVPKRVVTFDSEQGKRTGDFRAWEAGYATDWRKRTSGLPWGHDKELWQLDIRGQDLALVGDKIERGLRDAFTKHLLIDSKPRRISLVLPPAIPLPLLSSIFDILFNRFQSPSISLLSSPVTCTFGAGVRSALVVDIGWHETTVTGVYEYREVNTWRSVRAGKMLIEETRDFLVGVIEGLDKLEGDKELALNDVVSFEDCEEVATRMLWCKKAHKTPTADGPEGLPTLHEQDESEIVDPAEDSTATLIALNSVKPPKTVQIPFARLAEPCETTFFQTRCAAAHFDDEELPLHLLVYRSLLQLPMDVRAMCMSRIIFTGGCSNIIGLRGRIFDEVSLLAHERGWESIQGRSVEAYKKNPKLKRNGSRQANDVPIPVIQTPEEPPNSAGNEAPRTTNAANAPSDVDQVEKLLRKEKNYKPPVQGVLRAVDSMGPWCGASMATQLKVPALAMVDRELWLQQGVNGASKPNEVDVQTQQKQTRQSLGPGGLMRGQGAQASNWTLGAWGTV
jgi:hypothetical protein